MRNLVIYVLLFGLTCGNVSLAAKAKDWLDAGKAAAEHPDFTIQGEYIAAKDGQPLGVQVAAVDKGLFYVTTHKGGLPGDGAQKGSETMQKLDRAAVEALVKGMKRTERKSPTLGQEAPAGATVVFKDKPTEHLKVKAQEGGYFIAGVTTATKFGSFKMHLEYCMPFKPGARPSNQDRGNSGIYIFDRYECQVLDTFGVSYDESKWPEKPQSGCKQWGGSFYRFKLPDVVMAFPPLTWQTYDIEFTAPRFEGDKKVANARITVLWNGVKVHDDVVLPKGTGAGGGKKEVPKGPIQFQGHGNRVMYRNVWVLEK